METEHRTISPFAAALAGLLDDTKFFSRPQWARFLNVEEEQISGWVTDQSLPRADILRMILDLLRNSSDVPQAPIEAFERISKEPAETVSPLGKLMSPTVAEHLAQWTFEELGRTLRKLPGREQIRILKGSWHKGAIVISVESEE